MLIFLIVLELLFSFRALEGSKAIFGLVEIWKLINVCFSIFLNKILQKICSSMNGFLFEVLFAVEFALGFFW